MRFMTPCAGLLVVALLSSSCLFAAAAQNGSAGEILLSDCELYGSGGYAVAEAQCGRLAVPENPALPEGRTVELFVAVIASQSRNPAPDAFTFLAGGPGQAATTAYVDLSHAFSSIRRERDIVLVDQRGTGKSGALECAREENLLGVSPSDEDVIAGVESCLASLQADPRYYTTSVAVDDLETVRRALGYPQLNVYGGSYGTRVGLHYLRRYPGSVRTLILDGVVAADMSLGPRIALAAQRSLDNVFARCAAAQVCHDTFGDLGQQFEELKRTLRDAPRRIDLPHPVSGRPSEVVFDYNRFAVAVRLLSYAQESVALIPLLVHQAASEGHLVPLAAQAVMIEESLSEALSFGMHNSVVCTEDVPFYQAAEIDTEALKASYLGDSQVELLERICEIWPAGIIDGGFKLPVASELPVLLMSGSADPVTPPEYAERAAQTLPNHLHLVGKDMGHILAPVGCVPRLMSKYVEQASLAGIDASCLESIQPMPFFTNFNGPQP